MKRRPPRHGSKMWAFLEKSGIDLNDEAALIEAKKAYRRQYKKEHSRQQRENNPELTLRFTIEEWESLKQLAESYQKPLATTVKTCYLAFRQGLNHLPNTSHTAKLEQMLRIIQSDTRMIGKQIHHMGYPEAVSVIEALAERYKTLATYVIEYLKLPKREE